MQIMTLKQWHSNGRKGKINTRTYIKNKNWHVQRQYKIYLNRKRLPVGPIIKDLRLKIDDVD